MAYRARDGRLYDHKETRDEYSARHSINSNSNHPLLEFILTIIGWTLFILLYIIFFTIDFIPKLFRKPKPLPWWKRMINYIKPK